MEQPLTSNVFDTALVFEGGGMRASYTAAVVATLLKERLFFDHVSGISAGSSNTVNYLSRDAGRARASFVEFAADPQFGDLRTFLRGKGLFNAEYIYERTAAPNEALPFDWETFMANPARMRLGAFRVDNGETLYWTKGDISCLRDLMVRVRASSTIPIAMPTVTIDGVDYVDGAMGTSGGIPLEAAQLDGYDRFVVVLTREREYVKKPIGNAAFYRRHFRNTPALAEAILHRDIAYNRTRERLFQLEREGKALLFVPENLPVSNTEKRVPRLRASYQAGLRQAQRDLPKLLEFLGR